MTSEVMIMAVRITPIYMGSTESFKEKCRSDRDHPHIHGEHCINVHGVYVTLGSPPYTWGALDVYSGSDDSIRITPIYMGSTRT